MTPREVVEKSYDWSNYQTVSGIAAAAAQDIARTLLRIENLMRSLGEDGLHDLIRLAKKDACRRESRRLAKQRARRKAKGHAK